MAPRAKARSARCLAAVIAAAAVWFAPACALAAASTQWSKFGDAGYTADSGVGHSGDQSIRCALTDTAQSAGASRIFTLNQTAATPIVISGWSKASNVSGSADSEYSLYVDLTFVDGTPLYGQNVAFDAGTHGWQLRRLVISPPKPVRSLTLYALFRHHTGTVWFDDVDAHQLDASRLFDGQEITPPAFGSSEAGWFVRDLSAGSDTVRPIASVAGLQLKPAASREADVDREHLSNVTDHVRCITLYYIERYAPPSPVWWDDIRTTRTVAHRAEYGNFVSLSVGASGVMSLYPFGCVTGRGSGRVLGVTPDLGPRVMRIGYNGRRHLFYIAFDIALMPRGDRYRHDVAEVAVVRANVDPTWGFRDAAAQYYRLFPDSYRRRATADGVWMPFTDPSTVSNVEDFHVAYHEGDNSVKTDRRRGILSFSYIEPMTYWMGMAPADSRTYENALTILKSHASKPSDPDYRSARAVLSSGTMDPAGRYNVSFQNTPWSNGALWVLNPNPAINASAGDWTKARINALAEPKVGAADQPDGVYLDSLETLADTLDYRPESLHASTAPLTFSPASLTPTVPTWFSVYEDTRRLSQDLHRHGKLLMANSTPWRFPVFAPLLDVMGTETNWKADGKWQPDSDSMFNLRRTVSYHKPYLLLQNTDFTKFDKDDAEHYFQRCMFYGVFPSFFSADAATNPYWENKSLYDRDRPLFEKYIPVIAKLSHAGWEPLTYASAGASGVWLERYGNKYLTVLNASERPVETTLHIDIARFTGSSQKGKSITIGDARTGQPLLTIPATRTASFPIELDPSEVRILSVSIK